MTKIIFDPEQVDSFNDFETRIKKYRKKKYILFRGQSCDEPLLPKIGRGSVSNIEQIEREIISDFKSLSIPYRDFVPQNDWDYLAQAQHYGLRTRLLDWTSSPLIALWFTLCKKEEGSDHGVVWIFEVPPKDIISTIDDITLFKGGRTKAYRPNHISRRITAQQGWFTVHKITQGKFIPLNKNKNYSNCLERIKIPYNLYSTFSDIISFYGINKSTLFPEMEYLCQFLNDTYFK